MKNNGKTVLEIVLCLVLLFALTACGNGSNGGSVMTSDGEDGLAAAQERSDQDGRNTGAGDADAAEKGVNNSAGTQEPEKDGNGGNEVSTAAAVEKAGDPSIKDGKPVELLHRGCRIFHTEYNASFVYYAVEIRNPNEAYEVVFPTIRITAKSNDGKILTTSEETIDCIAAGDTILYGSSITYEGDAADIVDIAVENNDNAYRKAGDMVRQADLVISNASVNDSAAGMKIFTGEVTNNSGQDIDMVCVNVIYKSNGEIVGGESTLVDDVKKGTTIPFEIMSLSRFDAYDDYEIHALKWL